MSHDAHPEYRQGTNQPTPAPSLSILEFEEKLHLSSAIINSIIFVRASGLLAVAPRSIPIRLFEFRSSIFEFYCNIGNSSYNEWLMRGSVCVCVCVCARGRKREEDDDLDEGGVEGRARRGKHIKRPASRGVHPCEQDLVSRFS